MICQPSLGVLTPATYPGAGARRGYYDLEVALRGVAGVSGPSAAVKATGAGPSMLPDLRAFEGGPDGCQSGTTRARLAGRVRAREGRPKVIIRLSQSGLPPDS